MPLPTGVLCGHDPLLFRVHTSPLSVKDIMAIGIQAKHYMRYQTDFTVTGDAEAYAEATELKVRSGFTT